MAISRTRPDGAASQCPAWCEGGEPGHEQHAGMHVLDDDTRLVVARGPYGALTAEIIGEPSPTAAEGTVALSVAALARLAAIATTLRPARNALCATACALCASS